MGTFRFHLIGTSQPVELEVAAASISDLGELVSRQRFLEGRLVEPGGEGVMAGFLVATSRTRCVVEVS